MGGEGRQVVPDGSREQGTYPNMDTEDLRLSRVGMSQPAVSLRHAVRLALDCVQVEVSYKVTNHCYHIYVYTHIHICAFVHIELRQGCVRIYLRKEW